MAAASTQVIPRRAMVLAAGLGTRMRPLTDTIPKPLVKVAGKPLIDHVLDRLAGTGVERAVVNVHHFADQMQQHLAQRKHPQVVISDERGLLLGTGGGVRKSLPELGSAPFFHVNSDSIWIDGVKPNLARLADVFDPAAMDALLLLAPTADSIGYSGRGDFAMAPDGDLAQARRAGNCTLCLCGGRHPVARAFQRYAFRGAFADDTLRHALRKRVGCTVSGWRASGCMSARRRRSRWRKPRSRRAPAEFFCMLRR